MQKLMGFMRLARPANIVTAFSDVGAGVAIAFFGYAHALASARPDTRITLVSGSVWDLALPIILLLLATLGLYGGGVVLNDVFDAKLDAVERPERPIPSGLIKKSEATAWGAGLLLFGIVCAGLVHLPQFFSLSLLLAVATAFFAVLYDAWGKHQDVFGPVNMGICRGLNLLLGVSLIPEMVQQYWMLALVPVVYIAAITMISRGEVHGGKKPTLFAAALFYVVVIAAIGAAAFRHDTLLPTVGFLLLFAAMIFPPLYRAMGAPVGPNIGKAVKAGVLALILMNAAWAAAFGAPLLGLGLLLLLPLSIWLAKAFAVT